MELKPEQLAARGTSEPLLPVYLIAGPEPLRDPATLRRLHRDGWRLALATGPNRRGVARNLAREGWADLFLSSHCAERPKPY